MTTAPILYDLAPIDDDVANYGLECLCKSLSEPSAGDDGIWQPHESPFLRTLVEAFTQQGIELNQSLHDELIHWLNGSEFTGNGAMVLQQPLPGPVWANDYLLQVRHYLASHTLQTMTAQDWMMLVDYLIQLHMPPGFATTHSQWLTVRSHVMGKLEATNPNTTLQQANKALEHMPATIAQLLGSFAFTPLQSATLTYADARCAEAIVQFGESMRQKIKAVILQDLAEKMGAEGAVIGGHSLQTKLLDAFADQNRDWRRIAITEAGEAQTQGFVANMPIGARIKRIEHYRGACEFCSKIDGKIFDVVAPDAPKKDGKTQVWVGKTNMGRSASKRKKFMGGLVHREESELWWPAAGLQHPHCRGRWVLQANRLEGQSPDPRWEGWLHLIESGG